MHAGDSEQLLDAFERGRLATPGERLLLLLRLAAPETRGEATSVGRADAALLDVRERLFGTTIEALSGCPHCGERVELELAVADVRAAPTDPPDQLSLAAGPYELSFRVPNVGDLAVISHVDRPASDRSLLERCLVAAARDGARCGAVDLPQEVVDAVADCMARADPQAEVELALTCPTCETGWSAPFDIAAFLWIEIGAATERLLGEIHALASAYGWRERDILAMSEWRRRFYLDLIGT